MKITQKLSNIQKNLMGIHIKNTALDTLIPLIFKECAKEKLMFYFTFVENTAILKLHDLDGENKELNIRLYHETSPEKYEEHKKALLLNTFLITSKKEDFTHSKSSEKRQDEIISTDTTTPAPIQRAIEKIKQKGIPVDRKTIEKHIDLGSMGADVRKQCINYLKNMEGA